MFAFYALKGINTGEESDKKNLFLSVITMIQTTVLVIRVQVPQPTSLREIPPSAWPGWVFIYILCFHYTKRNEEKDSPHILLSV